MLPLVKLWDWTFVKRHEAASSSWSPYSGARVSGQGRGQGRAHSRQIMLGAERQLETNETRDSPLRTPISPLPASPPESPKGGEEKIAELLTQGGARDSSPRLPWAIFLCPYRAFKMKQRLPCRWSWGARRRGGAPQDWTPDLVATVSQSWIFTR